jgi:hypothetical protein
MLPISFAGVIIASIYRFYEWPDWTMSLMSVGILAVVGYALYRRFTQPVMKLAKSYGRKPGRSVNAG